MTDQASKILNVDSIPRTSYSLTAKSVTWHSFKLDTRHLLKHCNNQIWNWILETKKSCWNLDIAWNWAQVSFSTSLWKEKRCQRRELLRLGQNSYLRHPLLRAVVRVAIRLCISVIALLFRSVTPGPSVQLRTIENRGVSYHLGGCCCSFLGRDLEQMAEDATPTSRLKLRRTVQWLVTSRRKFCNTFSLILPLSLSPSHHSARLRFRGNRRRFDGSKVANFQSVDATSSTTDRLFSEQ